MATATRTGRRAGGGTVTPARRVAFAVLRRTFEQGAWADRALHAEAARARLDPRERALATRLAFGAVQRRATLDHVASALAGRPPGRIDPPLLAALRLGLYQLLYADGVADHAAVDQAVTLAREAAPRGAGFANAVLRRAAREGRALVDALDDATPEGAALRHSYPGWLAARWWAELGPDEARALMRAGNAPAEHALRANTLRTSGPELLAALHERGLPARPAPGGPPEGVVLDGPWDAHGSDLFAAGALHPQSRASMRVARALDPQPGERVLDLCAAPGGKATHLVALMEGRGEVVAVERHPGRAAALERTARRLGAPLRVVVGDARRPPGDPGSYDRVLVDPPCTGLGTLRSRPDLRWRVQPEDAARLGALQREILAAALRAVRPGGTVVYSVCTISAAEGPEVLAGTVGASWNHEQVMPHRDGTDGFFIARGRRVGAAGDGGRRAAR
jgi:16S rRNA (cytosine967-C5)-methyltransferase